MPRNGSGTMTVPNSFSPGTTIESGAMNANLSDLASEVTNSLPRDGQAGMTGPMKASAGTVSAPGITFASDPDTGFYRTGANSMGIAAGGAKVGEVGPSGFADVNGNPMTAFPAGTKMLFIQTTAPVGWTKDTTHNNKALRIVSGTAGTGGSAIFTDVFTARTLTQANLPNVSLAVSGTTTTDGDHSHTVTSVSDTTISSSGNGAQAFTTTRTTSTNGAHSHLVTGSTAALGSGTAMNFAVAYVDAIIATKD